MLGQKDLEYPHCPLYLPLRTDTDETRIEERQREKEVIKSRMEALFSSSKEAGCLRASRLQRINGTPGKPESFNESKRY